MTIDEAGKWAGRILGKPEAEFTFAEAFGTLLSNLEPFGIDVACVTYPKLDPKIMIVTRRAPWSGWRLGDDPNVLPQFKPGKREHVARLALEKHGNLLIYLLFFFLCLIFCFRRGAGYSVCYRSRETMISIIYFWYLVEMFCRTCAIW